MRTIWSNEEVKFLIKLYENNGLSLSELYPIFKEKYDRTLDGVGIKISKLKLKHTKEQLFNIKSRLNSGANNWMFGKVSPIKGLSKETSNMIRIKSDKTSKTRKKMFNDGLLFGLSGDTNPMYGVLAWNNGLTKYNDERIMKYGRKISLYRKKEWVEKSDEERKKVIIRLNDAMIQNNKPTKIENKIEVFLKDNKINYVKNKRFSIFIFDFYLIDYNFVIECDGDYWHANPMVYSNKKLTDAQIKNIDRDKRKNKLLNDNQIDFIRFWEYDIHNKFEEIKVTIWEKLQKK